MQAEADTGFDDVTNGYVPWSMSSSVPCAPSKMTRPLASSTSHVSLAVSATYCAIRWP